MARAERPRGLCPVCSKDCAITEEGGVRHHFTEDPPKQAGPDSRKCRGVGQPPAGAQPATPGGLSFLCRVPSGPTGCGHQVQLTANHRARSHQTPHGVSCAEGGSAFPIAVGPEGYRADTADWTEEQWAEALPKPVRGGEILPAAAPEDLRIEPDRDFDPRPVTKAVETIDLPSAYARPGEPGFPDDLPHDRQPDPHQREADAAIAEAERIQREQDAQYEQSLRDGLEESRRRTETDAERMHRLTEAAIEILNRRTPEQKLETARRMDGVASAALGLPLDPDLCEHEWGGADVWDEQQGRETTVTACTRCGLIRPEDDEPFDPTHSITTDLGLETHPGEAGDCRLPGCCTHPGGFTYMDDDNGHEGSFCRVCGAEEPEPGPADWRTPPDLLALMPEDVRRTAELNPECWECGHEVTPLVGRFGRDGKPEVIVWGCSGNCTHALGTCRPQLTAQDRLGNLDRGEFFVRHTARPPLNRLVYRVQAVTDFCVQATVVSAGAHAGRTGELTDLSEEITCTDLDGKPRPRRESAATQAPTPSPRPTPTPSRPAPPTPTRSSGRSSTPDTTASAPQPTVSKAATSKRATASGPTAQAATPTPSASTRKADVADAFSTAKQATSESDRYDRYGRYKLLHPVTGKKVNWTRATTYAKSIQDTFALSQWAQRMTLKGAALRPDIVAAVSTLDVKKDKDRVNTLVEDAKKAAGNKVAANLGTAVHAFTEDRDKALVGIPVKAQAIPDDLRPTVDAYELLLRDFGLEPVPGLIEFSTGVVQYEIAGTSDRCYKVTRDITFKLGKRTVTLYAGEYVIGDVKTGAKLDYGWLEICIQLAIYAQGLNTSGVWDWNTGQWGKPTLPGNPEVLLKVRTDVGLIPHLPVDREEDAPLATLFAVDLDAGWAAAVLCGQVRSTRKLGGLATALTSADVEEAPGAATVKTVVASRPVTLEDKAKAVTTQADASAVWKEAVAARTPKAEVGRLVELMRNKLASHVEKGA
jgi:hypothetical protein